MSNATASLDEVVRLARLHFQGAVLCYSLISHRSTYLFIYAYIYMYVCHHFALCLASYISAVRQSHHKDKHNVSCRRQSICTWRLLLPLSQLTTFLLCFTSISEAPSTAREMAIIAQRNRNINLLLMKMSISAPWCWLCRKGVDCGTVVN